jgi:GH15 family glucan-1,4-alpha-glucosidase
MTATEETQSQSLVPLSPFPPIADYAFLSDCHTAALVAPDGSIDWLCVPSFDAASVFGTLLDRGAGSFRLGPFGINAPAARSYLPGTNVLTTTWHTPTGWIVVRDALVMGPNHQEDTVTPHTRPPADEDAEHLLVRTVECIEGSVELELVCEPVFDYGRAPADWSLVDGSRHVADATGAGTTIRLQTDLSVGIEGNRVRARHVMRKGERAYCSLSWAEELASPGDVEQADAAILATTTFWREWLDRARLPDHRWREPIQRSALAIKGLTYMPTGATVAAATTSLPETPGGERNWDYRYTWMRDSTFTLQALHWLNLDWEADEFMQFVADLEPNADGSLQIMYGVDGRRDLTESTRDELSGYEGAHPVRIGNGAFDQRQNDVYGAVLDSILLHTRRSQRLPRRLWPLVQSQAEGATRVWREPDQGIWEARGAPQHYVSSKLMCWIALDRAAKLAAIRGVPDLQATWGALAEEIRADILEHGVDDRGVLRQHYDTDALDASTLLAALFGFLPGDDPRLRASVLAIADELTEDGFVLRYRTGETDDGLSGKEGTFLICSFWLVSALAIIGETARARDLMERLLREASPLGLYAEEFEVATSRHLGNFPQAFSHLALIEAAARIILVERLAELS